MTSDIITTFLKIPANKNSISQRRSVYGVGINDAPYTVSQRINGKRVLCPFYSVWRNMLQRCYSPLQHARRPNYAECTVSNEWLRFMAFRAWMLKQDWQKKHMDKDLLIPENKRYSPETCIFVSPAINTLLNNCKANRGKLPQGVYFHKNTRKFVAQIQMHGNTKHLGLFETPEEAESVYREAKANHIRDIAKGEKEPLRSALLVHAKLVGL